jgi:hypothetical protein
MYAGTQEIEVFAYLIVFIFSVILYCKIWGMANRVREMNETIQEMNQRQKKFFIILSSETKSAYPKPEPPKSPNKKEVSQ